MITYSFALKILLLVVKNILIYQYIAIFTTAIATFFMANWVYWYIAYCNILLYFMLVCTRYWVVFSRLKNKMTNKCITVIISTCLLLSAFISYHIRKCSSKTEILEKLLERKIAQWRQREKVYTIWDT